MLTATSEKLKVGRHGTVSIQVTASEILAAAVNTIQNGWPADGLPLHVLEFVYQQVLEANRFAVEKRLEKRTRQQGARGSLIITPEELERQWTSTR